MPFRSKKQIAFIFANLGKKEGEKWAADTPNIKDLPEYVGQKRNGLADYFKKSK